MIDVYAAAGTFGDRHARRRPGHRGHDHRTSAGHPDVSAQHRRVRPRATRRQLSNVDGDSTYLRVQVLTNAGAVDRDKQLAVVEQLTQIVATAAGDPSLADRA
jgi:hypothetical protein